MGAALAAGAAGLQWALANWKLALVGLLVAGLGVQSWRVSSLKADIATREAEEAAAVIAQKERDRALVAGILAESAAREANIAGQVITVERVIYREKPTNVCRDLPAMRAADDGLLGLGFRRAARAAAGQDGHAPAAP